MPLTPPPRIETPEFTLRVWSAADASALRTTLEANDAHLRAWTPWVVDGRVPGQSLEDRLTKHAEAFAAGTEWVYGIFDPTSGEILGGCGLYPRVGPRAVEIGYWLSASHTGRGLATRATALLTRLAFDAPDIDRVEIRCDPANTASVAIPRRLGYQPVGEVVVADGTSLTIWSLARDGNAT